MNPDIWIRRAALVEPYDGKGMSPYAIAKQTGLTIRTVRTYAEKFGFDFAERAPVSVDQIAVLAADGLTRHQIADKIGASPNYISTIAKENGIAVRHSSTGVGVDRDRVEAMAAMYRGGKTLEEIGAVYKVTRERVRQIISKYAGVDAAQGGQSIKASKKANARAARKDAESYEKYGCSYQQYRELVDMGKEIMETGAGRERTPTGAWARQKHTAGTRGVEWKLKLWDWWQIWQESGKWEQRGRGKGMYVMCRFGDKGAYEVGSVYIAKFEHNVSFQPNNPYRKGHPDHDKVMDKVREKRASRRKSSRAKVGKHGLPVGVYAAASGRYRAQVFLSGKVNHLGTFDTVSEADAVITLALSVSAAA